MISLIVVEFLLAPCKISFALIGCCDYFGSSVCSMISMKIAFSILSFYLILLFNFHYYSTCTLFQMNSQWIFWSTTTQRQRKLIIIWGVIVQCFREFKVNQITMIITPKFSAQLSLWKYFKRQIFDIVLNKVNWDHWTLS